MPRKLSKCYQIERNIKITPQNINKKHKCHSIYKKGHGWTNLKKIETGCNCGFLKFISFTLTVFQR